MRGPVGMACIVALALVGSRTLPAAEQPNIVLIVADDLGSAELGCYGQKKIQTPNIDRLAAEGMRFTRFYAGCHVCAPSRSVLMTGKHTGHTAVRANGDNRSLHAEDVTVAEVLHKAGYACGMFGKWGLGTEETPGQPNRQGFDQFFGHLDQVHAHFYYPYWLWKNDTRFFLPENEGHQRKRYMHDEIHAQAMNFLRQHKDERFFCYLPYTLPHVELVVPEDSLKPYRGKFAEVPLPDPRRGYIGSDEPYATFAGMVSRLDRHVGEILALLREQGLDKNTVVFFASDNGGQGGAWARMTDFFDGNGTLRGYKGSFYEGGLRVPLIARWPGHIPAGTTSDYIGGFQDMLPTLADLAGVEPPPGIDGISFLPTLLGHADRQKEHDFLYWEYPARNGLTRAARQGRWKLIQSRPGGKWELYDLQTDPSERDNVAADHADLIEQLAAKMDAAHTPPRAPQPNPRKTGIDDYVR